MKNATLILIAVAFLAACKQSVHDSGCITRYDGPPYYTVPLRAGQLDTIHALFGANGLSTANLNFTNYISDTAKDTSGIPYLSQGIYATLNVNGLPVFNTNLNWYFRDGILQPNNYNPQFDYPGSDTTTTWTLPALRNQFFKSYEGALYKTNHRNPLLARPGIYYRDSCMYAQLGYIDQWWSNNSLAYGKKLLKVWRIVPSNPNPVVMYYHAPSAIVFVVDSTGFAWCPFPTYPGGPISID
ncbi:MAG TPA: hypothetical protein VHE34_12155 [Puia sp.]|uniref:hypothetical protein n=1 Tax=Puia sp. TaxID=2045100 RepID=UPI002CDF4C13|nr:hypothetical protein [Puia sp.]HVU95974.1 hypothetical protein [Puia sp.]